MSWVYVAVGIACLIVLQMLRNALSVVFPPYGARPARRPDAAAFGGIDLIDAKTEALEGLGFAGPAWVGCNEEVANLTGVTAHAAYRNKDQHVVAWVGPTIEVAQPNQLLTYYTTLLQDGRYAVTQISDPYFAIVDDPKTPAQTIAASEPATEIAAHLEFVKSLGVAPANATPQEDVLRFAGEHLNGIRKRLLDRGLVRKSYGIARPSLGFALRMLKGIMTRPKPKETPSLEVPTSRLGFLAGVVERSKDRAPSQGMQWLLMLISGGLFVGIGWPLFGLDFTLILLAVIVLHEGGHWLAMKLFGYGNPHITLLPLLGGVTIGHENDPSAAKRAWVALAGPLPGIVLGWALLVMSMTSDAELAAAGGMALTGIVVLLFVNYLNVLPIPPLDGHHVVQAILPPRWVVVQIALIVIGVLAGIYVAWMLDFWPIAAISALQLAGIPSLWQTTRFVTQFAKNPVPEGVDKATHRAWIFDALDQQLGKPKNAVKRIALANGILHQLELQPMAWGQRTLVGGVYGALLVVPLAALIFTFGVSLDETLLGYDDPEMEALDIELDTKWDELLEDAQALDVEALVADIRLGQDTVPPTTEPELEALEQRMGSLPDDLLAFYRIRDGQLEDIPIGPAADVRRVDPTLFVTGDLQYHVFDGELYFWHETAGDVTVPRSAVANWWELGSIEYEWGGFTWLFLDPAAKPGDASIFVIGDEESSAYLSFTELLRERYATLRYEDVYEENFARRQNLRQDQVRDMGVTQLLDEFPEASILVRLITDEPLFGPGGASEADLAELADRVGRPLPGELIEAWSFSNGHTASGLLATSAVAPGSEAGEFIAESALELLNSEEVTEPFTPDLADCWIIGGWDSEEGAGAYATTFWCPDAPASHRFIDLPTDSMAPDYATILRRRAALFVW